jgi:transcriptional repressor NrdR
MVCIYCCAETRVVNSRLQKRVNAIWRRRTCTACGTTFTTNEQADLTRGLMVKGYAELRPFNRDALFLSIYKSCEHREKVLTEAAALCEIIISQLVPQQQQGTIERNIITSTTLLALQRFDKTAATVYDAFHSQR